MASFLALLGVFLIRLSKAGFATGLGMLSTPLMAQALPARTAIGVILPLLCLADVFTLAVYWRRWDLRLVAWPLAGTLVGIASATAFVTSISELALRRSRPLGRRGFGRRPRLERGPRRPANAAALILTTPQHR